MQRGFRVGFCVSGNGRLFRAAVIHADTLRIQPVLSVMQNKASEELEEFCIEHKIPHVRMPRLGRETFNRQITQLCVEADLDLLCLTFDRLLPPELVAHYSGRIVNVHPALLPAFAGVNALGRALASGSRFVGATVHEVDNGVDTGAIVAQCVMGSRPGETPEGAGARLHGPLRLMFLQVIAWYAQGRVEKDKTGRIWIRDASYGEFPISPAVELSFPD